MDEIIKEKWEETAIEMIDDIRGMDTGSTEKSKAINDVCMLWKTYIDTIRIEQETEEKRERRFMEDAHYHLTREDEQKKAAVEDIARKEQAKIQLIDIASKHGHELIALGITLSVAMFMTAQGYEYEKNDIVKSFTFKNVLGSIRPKIIK